MTEPESFASALLTTLDARDRYTAAHSVEVAGYAREIAAWIGLPGEQQDLAHVCGLVHDIGKISLRAGLLEKPDAFTREEQREIQRHSEAGERILSKVKTYAAVATVVRHQQERWDGEGHPDHLAGEEIPILSRVIAVADAYATMTAPRRGSIDAIPPGAARRRLAEEAGSAFDPGVIAALEGHDLGSSGR